MRRKQLIAIFTALVFPIAAAACGGGEQAGQADGGQDMADQQASGQEQAAGAQQGALQSPDWYSYDEASNTVTLDITAGETPANNHWNFNGHHNGDMTIVVPEGAKVTVNFHNADPSIAHSFSIEGKVGSYPPVFQEVNAVFDGAHTKTPLEMASATQPDQSETVTFTASKAGKYAMVCLVPGHATQGMWVHFNVSADGEAGVRMSS